MRLIRPRVSIRGLMIVVGLVALSIAAHREYQRLKPLSVEYYWQAVVSEINAENCQEQAGRTREEYLEAKRRIDGWAARGITPRHGYPIEPGLAREQAAYWAHLAAKYRQATLFPWMPIAPDSEQPTGEPPIVTEIQP